MSPTSRPLLRARAWKSWALALTVASAAHAWLLAPQPPVPLRAPTPLQAWLRVEAPAPPAVPATRSAAPRGSAQAKPVPKPEPALSVAPSLVWEYRLRHNGREGRARLSWQVQDGAYRLQLDRWLGERALPAWRSTGRIGEQGLAPSRYAELRGEREARATNFRREEGLISYSASSELQPLADATQDHISWWLQLAAIATAQDLQRGREVHLPVVGLRGEPMEWVFEVLGTEAGLLHLRRPALSDWDGTLDLWLDPARHHLPVRLQSGDPETRGWALEAEHPASSE